MREPLLTVADLSISYSNKQNELVDAVRHVDLTLRAGETVGLVGESGCGKSTLGLAMLAYLRYGSQKRTGSVTYREKELFALSERKLSAHRGRDIAHIPQNAIQSLTPSVRVGEQVLESVKNNTSLKKNDAYHRVMTLLKRVRIVDPVRVYGRFPHQLSAGQLQRIAIANALAGDPELLILDEPTTGLDVITQAHILTLLKELVADDNITMMYISHDLSVVAQVSERVAVMYAGEIVEDSLATQFFEQPTHPYSRGLLRAIPRISSHYLPHTILGRPPVPGAESGCAFAPRCRFATDRCLHEAPGLETIDMGEHRVSCHHWPSIRNSNLDHELPFARQGFASDGSPERLLTVDAIDVTHEKVNRLNRWLGQTQLPPTLRDISFEVYRGETLALVGESGSGKSTLVRTIAGLLTPDTGELYFGEQQINDNVNSRGHDLRQRIQLIFQNPDTALNPRNTVSQLLDRPLTQFFPNMAPEQRYARQFELLDMVRLDPRFLTRYPSEMSDGEKQRVAIARAVATEPDIILCDEITSALDVSVQGAILRLLVDLQKETQATYLYIAHDLAVVRAIADRAVVMYQGQLVEVGPIEELFNGPKHPYTEGLIRAALEPDPGKAITLEGSDEPEHRLPTSGCIYQLRCPRFIKGSCDQIVPPWQRSEQSPQHQIRCHVPLEELTIVER